MEEEKEKIIQKEVIHTGSVSCFSFTIVLGYSDWIIIGKIEYFFNLHACL